MELCICVFFCRRRILLKEMEKGPNKIIIVAGDLDFISSKTMNKSVRVSNPLLLEYIPSNLSRIR